MAAVLGGCAAPPEIVAANALLLNGGSASLRDLQSHRFDTADEPMVLRTSAALLQDLGFNLDFTEPEVGLIVAGKERTALGLGDTMQTLLLGDGEVEFKCIVHRVLEAVDVRQHMRSCVVTHPDADGLVVRVTFQRLVWNAERKLSKSQPLQEPEHYEEFFDRLAKAMFLEAHER